MHYLTIGHYVVQVLFVAYCSIVFTSHKGGRTGWGGGAGEAKAPPIFDRRFVRIIGCFTASHASPPQLYFCSTTTDQSYCVVTLCRFSRCFPLLWCSTSLLHCSCSCTYGGMCTHMYVQFNSFPLILHHWNQKLGMSIYMCVI